MSVLADFWSAFLLGAALGVALPPRYRLPGVRPFIACASATGLAWWLLEGRLEDAGFCAAALAVLAWDRWNRKGKRAAKHVGEKSRALLAAVVERLKDVAVPVPEGAGT